MVRDAQADCGLLVRNSRGKSKGRVPGYICTPELTAHLAMAQSRDVRLANGHMCQICSVEIVSMQATKHVGEIIVPV